MEFKPKKIEKVVISIRIDNNTLETIDSLSAKSEISRNEFITQALDFALKNMRSRKVI